MGGNVTAVTKSGISTRAEKANLVQIGRQEFKNTFEKTFKRLNDLFDKKYGRPIWKDTSGLMSGFLFNGSTSFIMDPSISDEEIYKYKPSAGDIDLIVPDSIKEELWHLLDELEEKDVIPGVTWMGSNKPSVSSIGEQINGVFVADFKPGKVRVQVDFEFLEFENDLPTEWSKFSHSSSFLDAKASIKAVHHKYAIRAIVGAASLRDDIVIATPSSTPDKIKLKKMHDGDIPRMYKFSVSRGIGAAYEAMTGSNGEPILVDGKAVYREMKSSERSYETVIENIYKLAFGDIEAHPEDVKKFHSFVGVLELMKKFLTKEQQKNAAKRYLELLWGVTGARGQELEVGNATLDLEVKSGGWNMMVKTLGLTSMVPMADKMIEEYYREYGSSRSIREWLEDLSGGSIW